MSGLAAEAEKNRKERRATRSRPTTSDQRLANLMKRVYDEGKVRQAVGESQDDYFARIRRKACQIMRYERAAKRKAARAARKANR